MYFNGSFGNNMPYAWGQSVPQNIKTPKFTNPLTEEQIKTLQKKDPGFTMQIPDEDRYRAICTHRTKNGWATRDNIDGTVTCTICGQTFTIREDPDECKQAVRTALDYAETSKMLFLDATDDFTRMYYQFLPWLAKLPQVNKIANDNFMSYNHQKLTNNSQDAMTLAMLDNITNPALAYQQPWMQPQQQPWMQPQQQPMNGWQQPMGVPQGYVMPNTAQAVGPFTYVDNGMAPGAAPAQQTAQPQQPVTPAPAAAPIPQPGKANDTVTQTKTFVL